MHKSFITWVEPKSIQLLPVKMAFGSLLDELELAEVEARPPKLRLGTARKLTEVEFSRFCQTHRLILAGQWNGFRVYTQPDLTWPPLDCRS